MTTTSQTADRYLTKQLSNLNHFETFSFLRHVIFFLTGIFYFMSSASLFEQLTNGAPLPMLAVVAGVILILILLTTFAFRVLFKSTKSETKSKQGSNKDKKTKEVNPKKQQTETNKKKNNNKAKKSANATPPPPAKAAVSASSSNSQSEESEDEKAALVTSKKQQSTSSKSSAPKKVVATDENSKPANSTNATKAPTKQQQQQASAPVENVDAKKKQSKTNAAPEVNKQTPAVKNDAANKVNKNASNKKQSVAANSEVQRAPVDIQGGSDQEDEGQWVTQGSKQVNNRNKNKGKNETSNAVNQEPPSNRKNASEKRSTVAPTTSTNKTEVDVELPVTSDLPTPPPAPQVQEPIEICQLLPTGENRYTASDDWWKQPINKQQKFSIDDIGDWPERDQDEQYTVQKRIIPVKPKALTEKDINVGGHDEINNYKNGKDDELKPSVVAGETKAATTTTASQSKKKSNVRRLS